MRVCSRGTCGPVAARSSDDDVSTSELWSWPGPRPFEVSPPASSQLISSTCRAKPCHSLSNSIFLPEAMQSSTTSTEALAAQNWNFSFFHLIGRGFETGRSTGTKQNHALFSTHPWEQFRFFGEGPLLLKIMIHVTLLRTQRAVTAIKPLVKNRETSRAFLVLLLFDITEKMGLPIHLVYESKEKYEYILQKY